MESGQKDCDQWSPGTPASDLAHEPSAADATRRTYHETKELVSSGERSNSRDQTNDLDRRDEIVVASDGDLGADNPLNWSTAKKWSNIGLVSLLTLMNALAASMFVPGVPQVFATFGTSTNDNPLATFVTSIYFLGVAIGPLALAPLSEIYGRVPVYHTTNVGLVLCTIACALSNSLPMLIAFRFLNGCFGAASLTIGGGTIVDVMPVQQRGVAMAVWSMGPLAGPIIAPLCGGFLIQAKGWRWAFWTLAIVSATLSLVCMVALQETYAPVLLSRKVARLQERGHVRVRSALDCTPPPSMKFRSSIMRPIKMLTGSPIVAVMALYTAGVYGVLNILSTTLALIFQEVYRFDTRTSSLTFIGIGLGMVLGALLAGRLGDTLLSRYKMQGIALKPEHRLHSWTVIPASLMPAGLFLYGWALHYRLHWIIPLLGTFFVGFGTIITTICVQMYLVDAFLGETASVLAANTILRNIFGAFMPLLSLKMYDALGYHWGNSMLAFFEVLLIPLPIVIKLYGENLRNRNGWTRYS